MTRCVHGIDVAAYCERCAVGWAGASTAPPAVERLRAAVDRLESVYERQRTDLQQRLPDSVAFEDLRDSTGRPLLLDALIAIVNARAALVIAGATS